MNLTYEKLIRFDLLDYREKSLMENFDPNKFIYFFDKTQEIKSVDQFIKDAPSFPGSTDKIIRNEMVAAIGATLSIEGTTLAKEEIEESFRKADLNKSLKKEEQEAENSRMVYKFIMELIRDRDEKFKYTESLIKQIHKYFTNNIDYPTNKPGGYRGDFPVTFGNPRKNSLCRTRAETEKAMGKFIKWLNRKEIGILSSNAIVKAIMAHYYLTEIHPFVDGNGRTARALEALILYLNGINTYCFWSLANFWSANRTKYLLHLHNIRITCDPCEFIFWGIDGYLNEIKSIKSKVLKKVKQLMLQDYAKYKLENKKYEKIKINHRILDLLKLLINSDKVKFEKFLSSPGAKTLYSRVSSSTRRRDILKMVNLNLIKFTNEQDELYLAPNFEILEYVRYNV
ncbi:MAG: Fic family protein [Candidatus Thorarchaeota archaeon]